MIPHGASHVQQDQSSVPPPEKSLKYMAWSIKEIAFSLKEIAASLSIMNNRFDRMEAAMLKGPCAPLAPAVQKMMDEAKRKVQLEDVPF